MSHAVTDNRADLNPQLVSADITVLSAMKSGADPRPGKPKVFLHKPIRVPKHVRFIWKLRCYVNLDASQLLCRRVDQESWPEQTDLLYKSHIFTCLQDKTRRQVEDFYNSRCNWRAAEHRGVVLEISRLVFEYAHVRTATEKESVFVFFNIVRGKGAVQRWFKEQSKNTTMQNKQKHNRGKQFLRHPAFLQSAAGVDSRLLFVFVHLNITGAGRRHLWSKLFAQRKYKTEKFKSGVTLVSFFWSDRSLV